MAAILNGISWAIAGLVVTLISGIYVPIRINARNNKREDLKAIEIARDAAQTAAIDAVRQPLLQRLQDKENDLAERDRDHDAALRSMERDRDFWRSKAMSRAVSLEKQDDEPRRQEDTDHDNLEDTP